VVAEGATLRAHAEGNRDRRAVATESNAPRVKPLRLAHTPEVEDARAFGEEGTLFGKEEREAREVDDLPVGVRPWGGPGVR